VADLRWLEPIRARVAAYDATPAVEILDVLTGTEITARADVVDLLAHVDVITADRDQLRAELARRDAVVSRLERGALTIELEPDGDRWIAEVPALPGCLAYGATKREAMIAVVTIAMDVENE